MGFERAGMTTVAFCEIEPFCRAVLRKHWPHVPIHEDIRTLDGRQYEGTVDLVCGGYPCQPFSQAGHKRGHEDPRHLWPEMFRLVRECRPRWVVAENVRGHISNGFDDVAAQLEGEGFAVWPFIIPASAVDAPHQRERLWVVAHTASLTRDDRQTSNTRGDSEDPSETSRVPIGGRSSLGGGAGRWLPEPAVRRVVDGIPNRVDRIRALGNAVVPQIPELIGRAILQFESTSTRGDSTSGIPSKLP